ncbi:hypothetical protein PTKIN_Ptkin03bG0208700 [Pterospermum kingtungense]
MQTSTGTNASTASQACAVCKYQRRKCTQNCLLAPFFPASNQKEFLNTRKLFGVRKIAKFIENLDPQKRVIAMKSIIFQANMRAQDPVHGCCRIIYELQRQIDWHKAELELVLEQLAICKSHLAITQQQLQQQQMVVNDQEEVNAIKEGLEGLTMYDDAIPLDQPEEEEEGNVYQSNYGGEDIKPLLEMFDDKGAGAFPFDCKGSIHWSDKLVLKEEVGSVQQELKHDLKDAASLFSLTNANG